MPPKDDKEHMHGFTIDSNDFGRNRDFESIEDVAESDAPRSTPDFCLWSDPGAFPEDKINIE